jgi:hypothetical protein
VTLERSLFGDGFCAVFAEFDHRAAGVGIRPRAASAIESCKLIHVAQEFGSANDALVILFLKVDADKGSCVFDDFSE